MRNPRGLFLLFARCFSWPGLPKPLLVFAVALVVAPIAMAESPIGDSPDSRSFFCCDSRYAEFATSDAGSDLYNGILYASATAGVSFGVRTTERWSRQNDIDAEVRRGLRLSGVSGRRDAALASDIALITSAALLPLASIGAEFYGSNDYAETLDMATDLFESISLTVLLTQSIKVATGRARPFEQDCGQGEPRDARCGSRDRFRSFLSGHASLSATGAGLTCAFSLKREAWGSSRLARYGPCGFGIATAMTTGLLRIASDRHWGTDVLAGFALGGIVGYFDTWGPFDLLKFESNRTPMKPVTRGVIVPTLGDGFYGIRLSMVF